MKKIILLLPIIFTLTLKAQKLREYYECEFYEKNGSKTIEYGLVKIKILWNKDNDSIKNLLSVAYPNLKITLDDSPKFDGIMEECPFYYFTGMSDNNLPLGGFVVRYLHGDFSISIMFGEQKVQTAIFKKTNYKYVVDVDELNKIITQLKLKNHD